MRNIKAIFKKQLLSFFKNPGMMGAPAFFLAIPFLILLLMSGADTDRNLIVSQFVVMFIGISMIGTASGFIAEDRLTMNLRFMGMAGVKPYQYLIGTCSALLIISCIVLVLFGLMYQFTGGAMVNFLAISILGAATSMIFGITLSLSKFNSFTMPISLLLGVGPIFAEANEVLSTIYHFIYTMQLTNVLREGDMTADLTENLQIILLNMAVLLVLFIITNARYGLDGEKLGKKL